MFQLKKLLSLLSLPLLLTSSVLAFGLSTSTGCSDDTDSSDCTGDRCDDIDFFVELDQGAKWEQFRSLYRYTSQGSRMVPYRWLINLEQATSQSRFVNAANMQRLGFNMEPNPSAESRSLNPDNLPIGLVHDTEPGMFGESWAGLTCSACHTGTMTYKNTSFLIDGASGLLDLFRTESELLDAVGETIFKADKLARFNENVLGASSTPEERAALKTNLEDYWLMLAARIERSAPAVPGALVGQSDTIDLPPGPGRVDAFTILINETICEMLPQPENCRPSNTPTTYGQVWGIGDLDWAQTNSLTHASLGRNVGEVLGVYAHSSLDNCGPDNATVCDFNSTVDIDNLVAIEDWLKDLDSPKWPSQFPKIDTTLASAGEALYKRDCESCHSLPTDGKYPTSDPNPDTPNDCRTFVKTTSTPICFDYQGTDLLGGLAAANCDAPAVIGTDPFLAANVLARTGNTGILAPIFGGRETVSAAELLGTMQTIIIQQAFAKGGYSGDDMARALDYRDSATPGLAQIAGYKARPLAGIAFAAPYLHNNAVASIYELLLKPSERAKEFWVGRTEFDPEKLGYDSSAPKTGEELFHFDATIPGNLNIGHEFGTAASEYSGDREQDRLAVLEYLKTLDVTPRTEPSSCE